MMMSFAKPQLLILRIATSGQFLIFNQEQLSFVENPHSIATSHIGTLPYIGLVLGWESIYINTQLKKRYVYETKLAASVCHPIDDFNGGLRALDEKV